jgi:hypothetical protein
MLRIAEYKTIQMTLDKRLNNVRFYRTMQILTTGSAAAWLALGTLKYSAYTKTNHLAWTAQTDELCAYYTQEADSAKNYTPASAAVALAYSTAAIRYRHLKKKLSD